MLFGQIILKIFRSGKQHSHRHRGLRRYGTRIIIGRIGHCNKSIANGSKLKSNTLMKRSSNPNLNFCGIIVFRQEFSMPASQWEYYKKQVYNTRKRESFIERILPNKLELYYGILSNMIKIGRNPDGTAYVYAAEAYGLEKGSDYAIEHQIGTLLSDKSMNDCYKEKYFGNLTMTDVENMRKLKDGTLGREYLRFLETWGLDHYYMKQFGEYKENPISYFITRYYEIHDMSHVITGYNVSGMEEIAINTFFLAQGFVLPARYALVFGQGIKLLSSGYYNELPKYFELISEAYQRGLQAQKLLGIKLEDYLDVQLDDIRKEFNIVPRQSKAVLTKDFQSEIDKCEFSRKKGLFTIVVGPEYDPKGPSK